MDYELLTKYISIFCILLAALLGGAGYYFKQKLERKKSARKVLYLLLEIRYAIYTTLFDSEHATDEYLRYIRKRIADKGLPSDQIIEAFDFRKKMSTHFKNMITSQKVDITDKLLKPFESALVEFATINPVLAYQLRGKENVSELITHTNNYIAEIEENLLPTVEPKIIKEALKLETTKMSKTAIEEISKSLRTDILKVAWNCGWRDYIYCWFILRKAVGNYKEYDFSQFDKHIDSMMKEIMKAVAQHS